SLLRGIAELPEASASVRREIDARAAREGWSALHEELSRLDPVTAARVHPNDPQRIQRALEVCYTTGQPLSKLQQNTRSPLSARRTVCWALIPGDKASWHRQLDQRFHDMMAKGFLDEVRTLYARGDLTPQHPSVRAVGYRQLWSHLAGEVTLEEAVRRGITATRQLGKRQLTWLRAERDFTHLDPQAAGTYERWQREVRASLSPTWP